MLQGSFARNARPAVSSIEHTTREERARVLASTRLFRATPPELLAAFAAHATNVRIRAGQQLWKRGDPAEHFYVVLRGVLELQRRPAGAAESTLIALFGPGESPAIPAALQQGPFIADAYAASGELEVIRVRSTPVLAALPTNVALALAMNRALLDHCRLLHSKIDVMVAGSVRSRLAAFFLDLAERFGDEYEDGLHHVPVSLSRHQVATYVGARTETVTRCCSAWQKSGLLATTADGFTISSLDALRAVLDGSSDGAETIVWSSFAIALSQSS